MAGRFSIETIFKATDQMSATIGKIAKKTSGFSKGLEKNLKSMDDQLSSVTSKVVQVAKAMGAVAAIGAGAFFVSAAQSGMEFEKTLSNVAAVSGATAEQIAALSEKARALGGSTKFTAAEVAGAMEIMSKAGYSVQEVMSGVGGILSAAAADGASIEDTARAIMSSMKGLGLGPEMLQDFADKMAKAGDATSASIGSIAESMSVFGPVAKQLNVPLDSAIAQLALLQDAGIDASSAGTTLAAAYSKLAAPTKRTRDELQALGLTVTDTLGNMKPPDQLFSELIAATNKIQGNAGKMAAVTNLVGLESQKAILNVAAAAGDGRLRDLTENLRTASGYADEIARKKMDNLAGDIELLSSATDELKLGLYDMAKGPLRELVQGFTAWIGANKGVILSGITEFLTDFKAALPQIVVWLERIGKILTVFFAFAAAVKVATIAVTAFNAVMAMNPYVLLVYAIVAAIALIWAFWPEITKFFADLWAGIKDVASRVASSVGAFIAAVWAPVEAFMKKAFQVLVGALVVIFWPQIQMFKLLFGLVQAAAAWVVQAWQPIGQFFADLWASIVATVSIAWDVIKAAVGEAYAWIVQAFTPIAEFFSNLWSGIASAFSSVLSWVMDKVGWLADKAGWIAETLAGIGGNALEGNVNVTGGTPQTVPPRSTSTTESRTTTQKSEVTVRAPGGSAAVTKKPPGGSNLVLKPTGSFG